MSNHVTEWLNAYIDGELHGSRLHDVQAHLAECDACLAELDSLENLSKILHNVPMPEFTSPERFAAQVNLRLPHKKRTISRNKVLEIGWWMIPVGLVAIWFFINTAFYVYDLVLAANNLGLLPDVPSWMSFISSNTAEWTSVLGQIGVLRGDSLVLARFTETLTRMSLPQITLQVSIAFLYLSWIAIWWTHQQRRNPYES
jgi:uncharacterized membrane protein